jgi:transposase
VFALSSSGSQSIFVSLETTSPALARQNPHDWIGGLIGAMEFYGGTPSLLDPDNPRALIARPDRYEPGLGRTTQEFVNHYATAMLPARPRKPRDKAYASYCTLCG